MLKPTKILAPSDFSRHADTAIKEALDLAEEYGAEVHILHVVEEKIGSIQDDYSDISVSPNVIIRRQKKLLRQAKMRLDRQLEKLALSKNKIKVIREVVLGVPYEEILRYQEEKGIDLVVISSLGTTGLAKYFIGGTARNVLKGSACSVLLTKGDGIA